jgi:dihydrofolate synthase / folylpolyglutamate synthase
MNPARGAELARTPIEHILLDDLPFASASAERGPSGAVATTAALLCRLGDPQDAVPVIHIAGTAGKGSVAGYLTAILNAHGFFTGTHMSPHVHTVLERFQLNGFAPHEDEVAPTLQSVLAATHHMRCGERNQAGFIEITVATAFALFATREVDYAIIETGIGGLRDATNTVTRDDKLAVITAIGLDHTEMLGATRRQIARQKAGILPVGGSAIALTCGVDSDRTILAEARRKHCRLQFLAAENVDTLLPAHVSPGLPGAHQRANAALAILAAADLAERDGWRFRPHLAFEAVARLQLPGRFEIRDTPAGPVILDGAHNPMKLAALRRTVEERFAGFTPVWILAMAEGKAIAAALDVLARDAILVLTGLPDCVPGRPVGVRPEALAAAAAHRGAHIAEVVDCPAAALTRARKLAGVGAPVIVCGSFRLVADIGARCL